MRRSCSLSDFKRLSIAVAFEPTATSSMQRDVEADRQFELEAFRGTVVRLGQATGVPTPVHRTIHALLRPALINAMT